jgi:hypothetical protein
MRQTATDPVQEIPVACTLSDRDLALHGDEIARTLLGGRQETRELADGYALRFPGVETWARRLLAFIEDERACCPFFTFELVFEPQQGPLWLHLRGPAGTQELVADLLGRGEEQQLTPQERHS